MLFSLEEASSFWSHRVTWRAMLCTTLGCFTLALLHGKQGPDGWLIGASGLLSFDGLPKQYYLWELLPFIGIAICCGSFVSLRRLKSSPLCRSSFSHGVFRPLPFAYCAACDRRARPSSASFAVWPPAGPSARPPRWWRRCW